MKNSLHSISTTFESVLKKKVHNAFSVKGVLFLILLLSAFSGKTQLLQWNTFGNAGTETTEPSAANNANISSASLTMGTITAAGNTNRFGGSNWFNTGNTSGGNTLAEAIAGNDYIQFIVTPNAGFSFTPTSFVFNWDRSGTGPLNVALRSSADGFTTNLGAVTGIPSGGVFASNTITISGLSGLTTATTFRIYGYGASATTGTGGFDIGTNVVNVQLNGTTASTSTPLITFTGALTPFTTTYGTASTAQSGSISGSNLTAGITATAPTGFQVSRDAATFQDTVIFDQSGGTASGTLSIRLKATATVVGSYNSQSIALTSTGATTVNVTTTASGNSVSPLAITSTGAVAQDKIYNGNTTAAITGATAIGTVNGDAITIVGGGNFAQLTIGNGIAVTPSLTLSGTNATSYTLTQPTGLTANITEKILTITGLIGDTKLFDGTTTATLSGTPGLSGVVAADLANVVLGGTYVADFIQSTPGTGIPIVVSGYTISGSASGNYILIQPTGLTADITSTPAPVINSSATSSETYGIPVTNYTITATNSPTSYSATNLVSGLSVNTSTGEISGTPTVVGTYTVNISATNAGGTGNGTVVYTIGQKALTVSGATASNKVYDGTNVASISVGTLVGIVGSDNVTLNGTSGTFASVNVGTGIAVTTAYTLGGADASKYVLTQSTLSADITVAPQTITFIALAPKTFGAADFALTATGGASGNAVAYVSDNTLVATISGNTVTIQGAGTANITASQAGNSNYSAGIDVTQALLVNQASQTITFAALPNETTADPAFTLTATGGASGNPVTFQSSNPSVATISGNTVTIVSAGTTNITASQAGNTNYLTATDVVRSLTVTYPLMQHGISSDRRAPQLLPQRPLVEILFLLQAQITLQEVPVLPQVQLQIHSELLAFKIMELRFRIQIISKLPYVQQPEIHYHFLRSVQIWLVPERML